MTAAPYSLPVPRPSNNVITLHPHGGAISTLPSGGIEIAIGGVQQDADLARLPFSANLAEHLPMGTLDGMTGRLWDGIEADIASNREHLAAIRRGLERLGLKEDKRSYPFEGACATHHSALLEALLRFKARCSGEMMPAGGPVREQVIADDTPELELKAGRLQRALNYYLTEVDEGYYPDFGQMLFWCGLGGSTFKKVHLDQLRRRPAAPFLRPDNLIIDYWASSLAAAQRITEIVRISQANMIRLQLMGVYLADSLAQPWPEPSDLRGGIDRIEGRSQAAYWDDWEHELYECHCDLDIPVPGLQHVDRDGDPTGLPLPYVATIDKGAQRIIGLYREWKPDSPMFDREKVYVHYRLDDGPGIYGLGLAHYLGGIQGTLTAMQRQQVDAATMSLFPAWLMSADVRPDSNVFSWAPMTAQRIPTGGKPIADVIMPAPFKPPDQMHQAVQQGLESQAQRISGTMDLPSDLPANTPATTILAMLEQSLKPQSEQLKNLHRAHRVELRMLSQLFAKYPACIRLLGPVAHGLTPADFANSAAISPVSDPNTPTQQQRLMSAQVLQGAAAQAPPGMYDQRELQAEQLRAMGKTQPEIDKLLPPPKQARPLDPVSELQAMQQGLPVQAFPGQAHMAHAQFFMALAQNPQMAALIQALGPRLQDIIGQHLAMQAREMIEAQLGQPLPPMGTPLPPEIEGRIAQLQAQIMQQVTQQAMQGQQPQQPDLMGQAALGEVDRNKQRDQMDFASKAADRESREKIATWQLQAKAHGLGVAHAHDRGQLVAGLAGKAHASGLDHAHAHTTAGNDRVHQLQLGQQSGLQRQQEAQQRFAQPAPEGIA